MKIEKVQITGRRFMFTVAFFLQSSALLTSFLAGITDHDSWIIVLIGSIIFIPMILIFSALMSKFPGKNLIQILDEVYGKVAGKIISITYIWFFINLTALNLLDLGDFAKITVMTETPHLVLTIMCMLVVAMAVRYGIGVVTRYTAVFTLVEFVIVGISIILLIDQMHFENLLPMFDLPAMKYVQSTHIIATIPFGELMIFLMINPNLNLSRKETKKYWLLGAMMGMLTMLIVLLRDISVLGNTLPMFALPGLVTLRLVNIGDTLSHMEILFAVALIMLLFFKITLLSYITVMAIAQLTKTKSYKHLVLVTCALIIAYGYTLFPNTVYHAASGQEMAPFIWMIFEIIIPILTLILAKLRKIPKASEQVPKEQEA